MRRHVGSMCTAIATLLVGGNVAKAVTVSPGQTVDLPGSADVSAGTVIFEEQTTFGTTDALFGNPRYSLELQTTVRREAGGTLDFIYRITNPNDQFVSAVTFANFRASPATP